MGTLQWDSGTTPPLFPADRHGKAGAWQKTKGASRSEPEGSNALHTHDQELARSRGLADGTRRAGNLQLGEIVGCSHMNCHLAVAKQASTVKVEPPAAQYLASGGLGSGLVRPAAASLLRLSSRK